MKRRNKKKSNKEKTNSLSVMPTPWANDMPSKEKVTFAEIKSQNFPQPFCLSISFILFMSLIRI